MNINEALRVDIAHVGDLVQTPGGDIGTISGLANLKNALFHCLITVPGSLVHRPTYGVGVQLFQNNLSSFSQQQKLANKIKEQFSLDPRVNKVSSVRIDTGDGTPQLTVIRIFVDAVGYGEQEMTYTPFNGGAPA